MYHSRFKGSHYAAGFKYGKLILDHSNKITSSPTFDITEEMRTFAKQSLPLYEKYYPEVVEEIKGMADGNQTDFDILCQILFSIYCFETNHHCSCFAVSDSDNIIFARNSDFLVSIEKLYTNCLYALDGVFAFNGNTTAFIEMEDGVNSKGLAVGLTFVYPHLRKPGLNAGMLLRYMLEKCEDVPQAVEAPKALPIASAQTFTLADKKGNIGVVECNSKKLEVIYPAPHMPFVYATNNFTSEEMAEFKNPAQLDDWRSGDRFCVIKNALEAHKGSFDKAFAMDILSGKYGFTCQYDRKTNVDTVWSVVYDLKNDEVFRVEGNPSRKAFIKDERMKNFIK